MDVSLSNFISMMFSSPIMLITVLLTVTGAPIEPPSSIKPNCPRRSCSGGGGCLFAGTLVGRGVNLRLFLQVLGPG